MLLTSGIIVEPQIIYSSLINGQLSDMWLYWSVAIGSAFSVSFFAHLWRNVPVKTENEFLFFRFSGIGAKILNQFRSLYLGLLVIPFIISFSLLAFGKILSSITEISLTFTLILLTAFLVILTFYNSLKARLRMDLALFIIFVLIFIFLFSYILNATGGLSHLSKSIVSSKVNHSIFPSFGTKAFNAFLIFITVQWWSAALLDYPDMNGQKLMASKNNHDLMKSIFLPSISILLFRLLLFTLPFMAVLYGHSKFSDSELVFTSLFTNILPPWMLVLVVVFFSIPFISVVQNMQNWGGALLTENFYKHSFDPNANEIKLKKIGIFAMVYLILAACTISINSNSLIGISKYLFAITAGVGPVFVLRWYWWRINAWSQLSAMVAALIFPPVLDWLVINNNAIHLLIESLKNQLGMDYYPLKIIILTILVCCFWLLITFITSPTESTVLQKFATTIKPGGFWGKFESSGKIYSKYRIAAWILQTCNGFIVYFMFGEFIIANYSRFSLLLLVFCLSFFYAFKLIQKANSCYEKEFEN